MTIQKVVALGRLTLKWYVIISALMFAAGVVIGAGAALMG